VRKRLKEVYYNNLILPVHHQVLKGQTEDMNALQELLGNWHDRQVALEKMGQIPRKMRLTGRLDCARRALRREKGDLLRRIRRRARSLYGQPAHLPVGRYVLVGGLAFGMTRLLQKRPRTIPGNSSFQVEGLVPTTD